MHSSSPRPVRVLQARLVSSLLSLVLATSACGETTDTGPDGGPNGTGGQKGAVGGSTGNSGGSIGDSGGPTGDSGGSSSGASSSGSPGTGASPGGGDGEGGAGATDGSGGSPPSTETGGAAPLSEEEIGELCDASCENTISGLRLPTALCEDFDVGVTYEFCEISGDGCSDDCRHVFSVVSEPCAMVLPAAISCVAASSTYSSGALSFPCLFEGCEGSALVDMVAGCAGQTQLLEEARDKWEAANVSNYTYVTADQKIAVVDGEASLLEGDQSPSPRTIEDWFSRIEAAISEPGWAAVVVYDDALGYPVESRLLSSPMQTDQCMGTIVDRIEQFDVLE